MDDEELGAAGRFLFEPEDEDPEAAGRFFFELEDEEPMDDEEPMGGATAGRFLFLPSSNLRPTHD